LEFINNSVHLTDNLMRSISLFLSQNLAESRTKPYDIFATVKSSCLLAF